jgi:trk system potassium uptake protein TrkA
MRIAIAGAGQVGRSIARELAANGHSILLLDRDSSVHKIAGENIETVQIDACEIESLSAAKLSECHVMVAATGDDKSNLVISLLAKTEFGVSRVVARVNHPKNEWMFDEAWGVDTAVSTPRILSALVEEAVAVGDLVKLMSLRQGQANLYEFTVEANSALAGKRVGDIPFPIDTTLLAILREHQVITPSKDDPVEVGDELLFVSIEEQEKALEKLLKG